MSVCDTRRYYRDYYGLFKLKSSDGDLVWECRDTLEESTANCRNTCVVKAGDYICTGTFDDSFVSRLLIVKEDSGGLVESVVETDDSPVIVRADWGSNQNSGSPAIQTDGTDFYLQGLRSDSGGSGLRVLRKYDSDGNFIDGFQASASLDTFVNARVTSPTTYVRTTYVSSSAFRLSQYTQFDIAPSATTATNFTYLLHDRQDAVAFDGTHFYCVTSAKIIHKIDATTLATASTGSIATVGQSPIYGIAKGGYLIIVSGFSSSVGSLVFSQDVSLVNTASMTLQWNRSNVFTFTGPFGAPSYQVFDVDVCSGFAVVAGLGTSTAAPETFQVKRLRLTNGATDWSVNMRSFGSLYAAFNQPLSIRWGFEMPRVVISADETKIYVTGLLTAKASPSFTNEPAMAVICLDASTGSVLWQFCAGHTFVPGGSTIIFTQYNVGTGMSLHDDGDHIYLSTVRCLAPSYR